LKTVIKIEKKGPENKHDTLKTKSCSTKLKHDEFNWLITDPLTSSFDDKDVTGIGVIAGGTKLFHSNIYLFNELTIHAHKHKNSVKEV
jgi:hypothetical protein